MTDEMLTNLAVIFIESETAKTLDMIEHFWKLGKSRFPKMKHSRCLSQKLYNSRRDRSPQYCSLSGGGAQGRTQGGS